MNHSLAVTALGLSAALLASGQTQACETSCSSKKAKPMAQMASYAPGNSWGAKPDIVETAVAAGSFKTLAAALDAAGLVGALQGDGPFTVFAPTDEAFAKIPKAQLAELLKPENKAVLTAILTYHVVPGRIAASEVVASSGAGSLNGQRLAFAADASGVTIDDAKVIKANIECSNGIIHVIDTVMIPETKDLVEVAVDAGSFKTLAAALEAAGLVSVLEGKGPFTVFAPTDEAFAALPKGTVESLLKSENREKLQSILKYHVSPGATTLAGALNGGKAPTVQGEELCISFKDGRVRINDAVLRNADIKATNGVIHVIDSVLLPPAPEPTNDLVGVARSAGKFKTLLAAVEAAGLLEALEGEGPVTILAPTDEAFAALPKGTVENLLKPENRDQLRSILAYHAFAGSITAGDALNAKKADTLNGQAVEFSVKDGRLKANQANIVSTDITCDNGIIHVIDAVLIPSDKKSGDKSTAKNTEMGEKPLALITDAIDRGVPAFNKGDTHKCATIYRQALEDLAGNEQLDDKMRKGLRMVLDRAKSAGSERDRAWIYRHTLDGVYHNLSSGS